jgi:hypothetical protein
LLEGWSPRLKTLVTTLVKTLVTTLEDVTFVAVWQKCALVATPRMDGMLLSSILLGTPMAPCIIDEGGSGPL